MHSFPDTTHSIWVIIIKGDIHLAPYIRQNDLFPTREAALAEINPKDNNANITTAVTLAHYMAQKEDHDILMRYINNAKLWDARYTQHQKNPFHADAVAAEEWYLSKYRSYVK